MVTIPLESKLKVSVPVVARVFRPAHIIAGNSFDSRATCSQHVAHGITNKKGAHKRSFLYS